MKLRENLADGDVHGGRNGAGRWMLYEREYQTGKESGEQSRGNKGYISTMYTVIYIFGNHCRKIEADPRRRDTRQSQNI